MLPVILIARAGGETSGQPACLVAVFENNRAGYGMAGMVQYIISAITINTLVV